jgi:serine/threonine-protein kinase
VPGQVIGTPEYISPEQANNKGIDRRSDLYSLGIVMYEMATGKNPFVADSPFAVALKQVREIPPTPRSLNPSIPEQLNQFIMVLLQKNPAQRYQNAKEALVKLKQIQV